MRIGSLFSGVGGLELGLEWSGIGRTVWQVEQSEFCRGVLARHWPNVARFEDVREVGAATLAPVDLICGGFPCQDISAAGKGAGLSGSRSGLWSEYSRIIREMEPRWVVVENVASGASRWVDAVRTELGELGYQTLPVPLSAFDVEAPHRRERIFIVAYAVREQLRNERQRLSGGRAGRVCAQGETEPLHDGSSRPSSDTTSAGRTAFNDDERSFGILPKARSDGPSDCLRDAVCSWDTWPPFSPVRGVDDGISNSVDRLKALGNAVVPQCAEVIGWIIRELAEAEKGRL